MAEAIYQRLSKSKYTPAMDIWRCSECKRKWFKKMDAERCCPDIKQNVGVSPDSSNRLKPVVSSGHGLWNKNQHFKKELDNKIETKIILAKKEKDYRYCSYYDKAKLRGLIEGLSKAQELIEDGK